MTSPGTIEQLTIRVSANAVADRRGTRPISTQVSKNPEGVPTAAVRLLAVDLDGTLLRSDRTPHPRSAQALVRASSAGLQVVLASGRNGPAIRAYSDQIGIRCPIVAANGAHVIDEDDFEVAHHSLGEPYWSPVADFAEKSGTHFHAYARDRLLFFADTRWSEIYLQRVRHLVPEYLDREQLRGIEVTKVMLVDEPNVLDQHQKELAARLRGTPVGLVRSEAEYLEFLSAKANKGEGLREIARRKGIERHEIAAIGDYSNDVPMLEYAGVSAAVSNASDDCKAVADRIVESNEEGGVASFVDSILSNRRQ